VEILCVDCQLFWEKRLEGLFACDKNGDKMTTLQLPHNIQGKMNDTCKFSRMTRHFC